MSVRSTTHNGKQVWLIQVKRNRGKFNRRRFLDRRTHRRQDALDVEAALISEYEAQERLAGDLLGAAARRGRAAASPPAAAPTFADVAARYLALQDRTRSDYQNKARYLRLHLLPHLGPLPIDAITRAEIDALKVKLRTPTGEPATSRRTQGRTEPPKIARRKGAAKSPKTINNILTTLRSVLHLAHDYELVHRVPRIRMEKVPRPDPVFLDDDEIARLLAATPPEWWLVVFTAVRTGLRRGELMALRWEDVHLGEAQPTLRVQRSVRKEEDGSLRVKEPKGGRARTVPICSDLAAALGEYGRRACARARGRAGLPGAGGGVSRPRAALAGPGGGGEGRRAGQACPPPPAAAHLRQPLLPAGDPAAGGPELARSRPHHDHRALCASRAPGWGGVNRAPDLRGLLLKRRAGGPLGVRVKATRGPTCSRVHSPREFTRS
ncbi:MAG: tyrosine-type recombinase/integrase [Nannocystaceae bacterium]